MVTISPSGHARPLPRRYLSVIEDDESMRAWLSLILELAGWTVKAYGNAEDFLAEFDAHQRQCLLVDLKLPGMNGLGLLEVLRQRGHNVCAIVLTGANDVSTAVHAMKIGAFDFLQKPFDRLALTASVASAFERFKAGANEREITERARSELR